MGKTSVVEVSHAHDPHGNQPSLLGGDGAVSSSAAASREIFQGLFKDLGKQAMAMESILRLVCGKVDKLESWVTEMSFGMTELDLQLRNIAHNIEGTAANVDDVPSVSRWAVPQEQDDVPTATVVKKVGVGPNKKKQMRMTGMVANILDQLTTVAETKTAAESESESHKGDDKKKAKSKAKKAKASIVGAASGVLSPLSASSAATTPRGSETTEKPKAIKKKTPEHDTKIAEEPAVVGAESRAAQTNTGLPHNDTTVIADDLKSALEQHVIEHEATPIAPGADTLEDYQPVREERVVVPLDETTQPAQPSADETSRPEASHVAASKDIAEVFDGAGGVADRVQEAVKTLVEPPSHVEAGSPEAPRDQPAVAEPLQRDVSSLDDDATAPSSISAAQDDAVTEVESVAPHELLSEAAPAAAESIVQAAELRPDQPNREQVVVESDREIPLPIEPIAEPPVEVADEDTSRPLVESVEPSATEATSTDINAPDRESAAPNVRPEGQNQQVLAAHTSVVLTIEPINKPTTEPSAPQPFDETHHSSALVTPSEPLPLQEQPLSRLTKSPSKKLRHGTSETENDTAQAQSPTKKGSRRASIRKSIAKRDSSLRRKITQEQSQPLEEETIHNAVGSSLPPERLTEEGVKPMELEQIACEDIGKPILANLAVGQDKLDQRSVQTAPVVHGHGASTKPADQDANTNEEVDDEEEEDDDNDDDDDDSSSGSDGSVLDLDDRAAAAAKSNSAQTPAEKRMTLKLTRTLTALNKLREANVLTPEEIAELKQRATKKWFKLRDHVKEKNKKDVANILLKRKKNIFTVSNRIELLEEKSREVYASIKQLNTDLKGKVEMTTFEGLRRHVHDIHVSLQVLDDKVSQGNTPAMDRIKQLAKDTEAMRLYFLEQLQLAREHCDANHTETLTLFDDQWLRVLEIEKNIRDKLTALVTEYDDKLHDLPDYTDVLEGLRRAVRKKADMKALRELETKLLGHDADTEECLVRCLSCHKEVVNAGHEASQSQPADDHDGAVMGSPHFKRVNPGTASARVYRSNVPLNAQPFGMPESTVESLRGQPHPDDSVSAVGLNSKPVTPSRRAARGDESKPAPLSFIHVTATRAISAASDSTRPISAPVSALKKKAPSKNPTQQ